MLNFIYTLINRLIGELNSHCESDVLTYFAVRFQCEVVNMSENLGN